VNAVAVKPHNQVRIARRSRDETARKSDRVFACATHPSQIEPVRAALMLAQDGAAGGVLGQVRNDSESHRDGSPSTCSFTRVLPILEFGVEVVFLRRLLSGCKPATAPAASSTLRRTPVPHRQTAARHSLSPGFHSTVPCAMRRELRNRWPYDAAASSVPG
jgi:hypothetical protein